MLFRSIAFTAASIIALLVSGMLPVSSGQSPVHILRSIRISSDVKGAPHAESFLAIDPLDDRTMLATSSAIENGNLTDPLYVTNDGGRKWRRVHFDPKSPIRVFDGGDPTVYFDPQGRGFFIVMGHSGFTLASTDDRGRTWTRGTHVNVVESYDRNYFAFDTTGRYRGNMYSWGDVAQHQRDHRGFSALAMVVSKDRGNTFGPPRIMTTGADDPFPSLGPIDLLVMPDGTLVMPMMGDSINPKEMKKLSAQAELFVASSPDGGATVTRTKPILKFQSRVGSVDATEGWGGIPRAAIDLSNGPYRGRMYLVYFSARPGGNNIFVIHSSDAGKTWSKPVKVNDDASPNGRSNATVAVNARGVLGVLWNDRRSNPRSLCYQAYVAVSLDGGMHFSRNVPLRTQPTCPMAPGNFQPAVISQDFPQGVKLIDLLMVPTRWSNGGDTQSLASTSDGIFHAAWIDGSSGTMQIEQTDFAVDGSVNKNGLTGRGNVFPTPALPVASVLGDQVGIEIVSRDIDMEAGKINISIRLRNTSQRTISGPLSLAFQKLQGNLPRFRVTNADNKAAAKGALWKFVPTGASLAPGAVTETRIVSFSFGHLPKRPAYPTMFFTIQGK